jgi:predicted nucleic acid-binding Zn ribbon protein
MIEKSNTELYLTFYAEARKEVYMRHDFLQKTLTLSMVGIFALLSLAISKPFLFVLVPIFVSFNYINYLYNLISKSVYGAYCRILELHIRHENPQLQGPLFESFVGTFSQDRKRSRNFSSIWALRSALFPLLLLLSVFAYITFGERDLLRDAGICFFFLLDGLATLQYLSLERENFRRIRSTTEALLSQMNRT